MSLKIHKKVKEVWRLRRLLKKLGSNIHEVVEIGREGEHLLEAKLLHAKVYRARGFVIDDDLEGDIIHDRSDPHQYHSHYFAIKDIKTKRLVALSRQIEYDPKKKDLSFPLLEKAQISQRAQERIARHDLRKCVEISALAKERGASGEGPLMLYKTMLDRSVREGHTLWIMAVDVRLFHRLRMLIGDVLEQIGPRTSYQGGDVIPAMMQPRQALAALKSGDHARTLSSKLISRRLSLYISDVGDV